LSESELTAGGPIGSWLNSNEFDWVRLPENPQRGTLAIGVPSVKGPTRRQGLAEIIEHSDRLAAPVITRAELQKQGQSLMIEIRCSDVKTNGVTLRLAEAGPSDRPVLFLLHGFPEYWRAWTHYGELFATAGWGERDPFGAANLRRKPWVYAVTEGALIIRCFTLGPSRGTRPLP
jgi:hypothetical protein